MQVFTAFQFSIFSWQLYAIKYERDQAGNYLTAAYNTYANFNGPTYFENYYENPLGRFYIGTVQRLPY